MRSRTRILLAAGVVGLFAALSTIALASNPHFRRGGSPTCTIASSGSSSSTTCTASLTGLGQETLVVNVTVSGFAVYQCQNPSGQNEPAGQNRVLVGPVTSPTTIPADQIKNGNVTFTSNPAVLTAPTTVTGTQAGCNNNKWTGVNPTLTVTNISMTISQGGVLLFTCTASNPNGLTGTVALSC